MLLTRSLTSGLTRRSIDRDAFWGVGDRGPNIKPAHAAHRYGLSEVAALTDIEGAKIMPLPKAGPSIARFRLIDGSVALEQVLVLRAPDGTPLSGLSPPVHSGMEFEPLFALDGTAFGPTPDGIDAEGIAALADGGFWISEEYGPSLLQVGPDGVVARRLVPEGAGQMFAGSLIPTIEKLPAIALARKLNRGFEGLALSHDDETLFVAFQSPLSHPDRQAHDQGDIVRIWALDPATGAFRAQYAYPLDQPGLFQRDCAAGPVSKSDVKVSELASLPDGSLLVLERVTLSTHIYRVRLESSNAVPRCFLDPEHRPTLEQLGQAGAMVACIPMLSKRLVLSTDDHPQICGDLEGMVVLDDGRMLLANDSDYGMEGAVTQFWRISLPNALTELNI